MADNLRTEMRHVISEWKLEEQLVAVVTDDAASITAIRQVQQTDGCQAVKHLPCFAHTLNLVVEHAAQAINNLKTKVKTLLHISIRISLQLQNSKSYKNK